MVASLSRWSEQSGASPCIGGEYSDVPATHPFCAFTASALRPAWRAIASPV